MSVDPVMYALYGDVRGSAVRAAGIRQDLARHRVEHHDCARRCLLRSDPASDIKRCVAPLEPRSTVLGTR